jgi:hypothetical protein
VHFGLNLSKALPQAVDPALTANLPCILQGLRELVVGPLSLCTTLTGEEPTHS